MPKRSYSGAGGYRYGFNGKENDNEVKGLGNQVNFENRIYDPRIGKWFSLDPLQKKYPNESNYAFVSNSPVLYTDKDGKDKVITITIISTNGQKTVLKIVDKNYFEFHASWVDLSRETGYPGREFRGGHKYSVFDNYVIDLADPKNNSYISSSKIEETYNFIITYQAAKLFGPGDQSSKMKVGSILMGSGNSIGDAEKNERAAEGSEILDIGKLVTMLGYWREFGVGSKQEAFDFLKEGTYLKKILEYTDNLLDAASAVDDALDLLTPRIEPGKERKSTFVYQRDLDYLNEKKGSIQTGKYMSDTVTSISPSKTKGGVDTFHIKNKKQ